MLKDKDRWVNDIRVYIDILIKANDNYIKLIGLDCIDNMFEMESKFLDLSRNISILFPIKRSNGDVKKSNNESLWELKHYLPFLENRYEEIFNNFKIDMHIIKLVRNKIEHSPHQIRNISSSSGSGNANMDFHSYENYYDNELFNEFYKTIKDIEPSDDIEVKKDPNGEILEITYKKEFKVIKRVLIGEFKDKNGEDRKRVIEIYKIGTSIIKDILIAINKVFIEIMIEMNKFADSLDEKDRDHPFVVKYCKPDFNKMNEVLKSNDLYLISKIINQNKKYI